MQYKPPYKEQAIQLIAAKPTAENGRLEYTINEEAARFIRNVPEPLAIISVAGLYRTGKSYLLNRVLLNRSDGFGVGPTVNPCTKGLWIWGKPIAGRNKNNQPINVLIIDSEGFGAVDEDANHDARIFALTLLLSSCFMYNSIGSIDEMAIQNVSLVTNIAKSIKQKNNEGQQILQSNPQFYWILRDFSLQLMSNDGREITAKQYMEKALEIGSNPKDDKSRIRADLTSFFPERDCITLIRPLTNEDNLQELDKMELEKLRPEFVQQIIHMRKKVLTLLQPKKFFGKAIDGEIFCQIVQQYVDIINGGAVPNLQSIWTYISKNECEKAKEEALDFFEENVAIRVIDKLPMTAAEVDQLCSQLAKGILIQYNKKVANFEGAREAEEELASAIYQRIKEIKNYNETKTKKEVEKCITNEFNVLERRIKSNDFRSVAQLAHQIDKMTRDFKKTSPVKGPIATSILHEYLFNKALEGAENIMKTYVTEIEKLRNAVREMQRKNEADTREFKNELNNTKTSLSNKISKLQAEKAELNSKVESLKESLNETKMDKERLEETIEIEQRRDKSLSIKAYQDVRLKMTELESKNEDLEKKLYLAYSDIEKNTALMNQKVEFQQKTIDEYRRKLEAAYEDAKTTKENWSRQLKEISTRNENTIKTLQKRLAEAAQKNAEEENETHRLSEQVKLEKQQNERLSAEFAIKSEQMGRTITKLQMELKEKEAFFRTRLNERMTEDNKAGEKLAALQGSIKEKDEQLRALKVELNKEKGLLQQKQEFFEQELKELRTRYEEEVAKSHSIFKLLESKQSQKTEIMSEIRNQYAQELQELEKTAELERRHLKNELELIAQRKEELEMNLQRENEDLKRQLALAAQRYEALEQTKNRLYDQSKQVDIEKYKSLKVLEDRHAQAIMALESEIEAVKEQALIETRQSQRKNEETLSQLKNFYQMEKERLEKKIMDLQQKCKDLTQLDSEQIREELELRIAEYERDIEDLSIELRESKTEFRRAQNESENQIALLSKEVESLREQKKELKELLDKARSSLEEDYGNLLSQLKTDKKELEVRLESVSAELNKREKEYFLANNKKEGLEAALMKKEALLQSLKSEFQIDRKMQESEIEKLKDRNSKTNETYLSFKLDIEKQLALCKQENEFLNRRITELVEDQEKQRQRYEETLTNLKTENALQNKDASQKTHEEYIELESRFDKYKKTVKEEEGRLNRQLNVLQKQKTALLERLATLESSKSEDQNQHTKAEFYQIQITELKEEMSAQKSKYQKQLERVRQQNLHLEEAKTDIEISYEKDRLLWQNKIQFVESQRDQCKQDLAEAMKKFESTISHLSKNRSAEDNFEEVAKSIERKYSWQIDSLKQSYERKLTESEERIKTLQGEIKALKQANNQLKNERDMNSQREKLQYLQYSEISQLSMMQTNSEQFDKDRLEYQDRIARLKEDYSRRTNELERKNKEIESKYHNISFGFEKQYVKWNIDRKCLQDRIQQLVEVNERMYRELQRYKNKEKEANIRNHSRRTFKLD